MLCLTSCVVIGMIVQTVLGKKRDERASGNINPLRLLAQTVSPRLEAIASMSRCINLYTRTP